MFQMTHVAGSRGEQPGKKGAGPLRPPGRIDPYTTLVPLGAILALCAVLVVSPERANAAFDAVRAFLCEDLGAYYLALGLGVFCLSLFIAFSPIGGITLGTPGEKPRYGFWAWGTMVFTCGLAADILFYALTEWISYAQEPRIRELGPLQDWALTYSFYHWGPIPWSFYAVLAACFGFMLHVRNTQKQKYSEACRPVLGAAADGPAGRLVDVLAVFALIAGAATTFSVATPLLAAAAAGLLGLPVTKYLTIGILAVICLLYTLAVIRGIKGVSRLANICMALYGAVLLYILLFGGQAGFILRNGTASLGRMAISFLPFSVCRESGFSANWTVFYWAYWMVWSVAAPFFMGSISRGRTVRQVILGAYGFGMSSTLLAFCIVGGWALGTQIQGRYDALSLYAAEGSIYAAALGLLETLPQHGLFLALLIVSMMAFYATSFDSITLVAAAYSCRTLGASEEADGRIKLFWAILFILLPIALLFSESGMRGLQTVSILAAFPLGLVILLVIASFLKDAVRYLKADRDT